MKQNSGPDKAPAERVIKDIRRAARRPYSAEEKIRIVLEGLRGEESIAEICRREGIASSMASQREWQAGWWRCTRIQRIASSPPRRCAWGRDWLPPISA